MREDNSEILDWLMAGDPAIRWQVMQDLLGEDESLVEQERMQVADSGWGAQFLAHQDADGTWGGGIYSPKWISTTYTMLTLRRIGLHQDNKQASRGCQQLLDRGYCADGGINYSKSHKESEACITGMVLSILAYFRYPDPRADDLADHLLRRQMEDGGWNCQDYHGATHSSFHTTISVLEGLLEYQKWGVDIKSEIEDARIFGHEFLLQHQLFRSHRTGEVVDKRMLRFHFPPRWYYDVLRALDYFQEYFHWRTTIGESYLDQRSKSVEIEHVHDQRFCDGIALLKDKRKKDGKWLMMRGPSGRIFFEMEQAGKPGRWNTLRALRVLNWWEGEP